MAVMVLDPRYEQVGERCFYIKLSVENPRMHYFTTGPVGMGCPSSLPGLRLVLPLVLIISSRCLTTETSLGGFGDLLMTSSLVQLTVTCPCGPARLGTSLKSQAISAVTDSCHLCLSVLLLTDWMCILKIASWILSSFWLKNVVYIYTMEYYSALETMNS